MQIDHNFIQFWSWKLYRLTDQ